MFRWLILAAVSFTWCGGLQAGIIHVPTDQPTIQAGINAATNGDTMVTDKGTCTGAGNHLIAFTSPSPGDRDGDGVPDSLDNCLIVYNPSQSDTNGNGIGDACDYSAPGTADVRISLNGGADRAYLGATNTLEIWIANGSTILAESIPFEFTSFDSLQWIRPYGTSPLVNPIVKVEPGAFNPPGNVEVSDVRLPDSILFGFGAGICGCEIPPHPSHVLGYTMKFKVTSGQSEMLGGFCVNNIFFPPAGTWTYDDGHGFAPDFQGQTNTSQSIPDAPPVCFNIVHFPGDANGDGITNISDALFLVAYIFIGGPAPNPLAAGDYNCDSTISISDVVYLIAYIFAGGPAPCG